MTYTQLSVNLKDNAQGSLSISSTGAQVGPLAPGIYDVWTTTDCYIKVAVTASDVTASTGYLLRAGNTIPINVGDESGVYTTQKIGAITSSATGTLYYHKVT